VPSFETALLKCPSLSSLRNLENISNKSRNPLLITVLERKDILRSTFAITNKKIELFYAILDQTYRKQHIVATVIKNKTHC
jgi:hypothetical protein